MTRFRRLATGAVLLFLALVLSTCWILRSCHDHETTPGESGQGLVQGPSATSTPAERFRVSEKTFRPPVVRLPFTKKKQLPVAEERLPIPKDQVAETIRVETPAGATDIIIDRKGQVFEPVDTPADTKITRTIWKPAAIAVELRLGASMLFSGKPYFALSLDYLRVGRFYLGSDIGISRDKKVLIGVCGRFHLADLKLIGRFKILPAVGFTPMTNRWYFGITVKG